MQCFGFAIIFSVQYIQNVYRLLYHVLNQSTLQDKACMLSGFDLSVNVTRPAKTGHVGT